MSSELIRIFAETTDYDEMQGLFNELLTPKERADMELRWQLLKDLYQGKSQRTIAAEHHISLCKITRGSKILKNEHSISRKILAQNHGG
ncbi:MAG: Trp operon repressor [Deltaproteobacteria bacterium ADurb.Bin510]|nr:MAG: Trp operon repressor [Deltaproteobacteria bacterium ADurb.Bin510]